MEYSLHFYSFLKHFYLESPSSFLQVFLFFEILNVWLRSNYGFSDIYNTIFFLIDKWNKQTGFHHSLKE